MASRQIKVSFNDKRIPGDVTLNLPEIQYRILYLMNKNNEIDIFDLCCYLYIKPATLKVHFRKLCKLGCLIRHRLGKQVVWKLNVRIIEV